MSIMMNSAYAAQINDADKEFYAEGQAIEIYEMTEEEAAQNPGKTEPSGCAAARVSCLARARAIQSVCAATKRSITA